MANIAAFHDLSGIGRCSLTAAISILSAMGHHCWPLPTAVLSNQTGFGRYTYLDFTPEIPAYLSAWDHLNLTPDVIYTGFLGGETQPSLVAEFATKHPHAKLLVDPVLGDNGALYPCYASSYVSQMRHLATLAHIITPNTTELLLMAGRDPAGWNRLNKQSCMDCLLELGSSHLEWAVITGFVAGDRIENILINPRTGYTFIAQNCYNGISYSGTGDIFASVLCGWVAHGIAPEQAVGAAGEFISMAVDDMGPHEDPRMGIRYEPHLHKLALRHNIL